MSSRSATRKTYWAASKYDMDKLSNTLIEQINRLGLNFRPVTLACTHCQFSTDSWLVLDAHLSETHPADYYTNKRL